MYHALFQLKIDHFLRKLQAHPQIVRQFGYIISDDQEVGIVMDFLRGGNLLEQLKDVDQTKYNNWDVKWQTALQVARALNYVHAKHVIHRNIKSLNFLVSKYGDIKLCDFKKSIHESKAHESAGAGTLRYKPLEAYGAKGVCSLNLRCLILIK